MAEGALRSFGRVLGGYWADGGKKREREGRVRGKKRKEGEKQKQGRRGKEEMKKKEREGRRRDWRKW